LDEEYGRDDGQNDGYDGYLRRDNVQPFYGRGDRNGRRDDPVGNECAGPNDGKDGEPTLSSFADEGVQGENSALSLIVGTQGDEHVFEGCLKG